MNCTKAIIPVAGYGTRRLPITKSIEKCMLPIVNRPVIDYVVEDCIKAGVKDIYFVVSPGSTQLQDYYSQKPDVAAYLRMNGKENMLPLIEPPHNVQFHFIEQDTSPGADYGTAIPVWLCREFINTDEHVLVLMGDDFIFNPDGTSEAARLIEAAKRGGSALLAAQVPHEVVNRYGVIAAHEDNGVQRFDFIQEKPPVEEAASNLINISKYIFEARFFHEYLEAAVQSQQEGEYYITDPMNAYVADGNLMQVLPAHGEYLDSGTAENWIHANNVVLDAQNKS